MLSLSGSSSVCFINRIGIRISANGSEFRGSPNGFPSFLPREVERIRNRFARRLAKRIERLPVHIDSTDSCVMSSCVRPRLHNEMEPIVLLHGFDSSCLEWKYTYPLLEGAGLETWAVDILGWGFSDLEKVPSCSVACKREHLYKLWKTYIKKPMILVGPSLGAAVAVDFAVNHSDAVSKLILIDASVYAEGTGKMTKLPKPIAYAGVSLLKSSPLRLYANLLTFKKMSLASSIDWANVVRLHCLLPWWEETMIDFMSSGGYNVISQIKQIKHQTLILWGEDDQIISNTYALRLHRELENSILHQIPDCGHIPHLEKPHCVAKLVIDFVRDNRD